MVESKPWSRRSSRLKSRPSALLHSSRPPRRQTGLVLGSRTPAFGRRYSGNAVAEHSAGLRVAFEDGDLVAGQEADSRPRPFRPAPNRPIATRLPVFGEGLERQRRLDAALLRRENRVAGVAVAVPDGDGLVHLVAAAVVLARRRADAAKDGRKGMVRLKIRARLAELPLGVGRRKPGMSIWLGHLFWQGGRQ